MLLPDTVTMPCPGVAVKAVGYERVRQFEFRFWLEADVRQCIVGDVVGHIVSARPDLYYREIEDVLSRFYQPGQGAFAGRTPLLRSFASGRKKAGVLRPADIREMITLSRFILVTINRTASARGNR
jgi:hypothetical protein